MYFIINNDVDKTSIRQKINYIDLTDDLSNQVQQQNLDSKLFEKLDKNEFSLNGIINHANSIFQGDKIVHLDLKGAPPVIEYYNYFFKFIHQLGATGILIEYEDMFPYEDDLSEISSGNHYSKTDLSTIKKLAKENHLMIIPLVQTFGHMEFVLKLEKYKNYREVSRYPQVVCPTYNGTLPLIKSMIDQIVKAHLGIKYLHIGADEVYNIGECQRCIDEMSRKKWGKQELFLNHVTSIARYIKTKYPYLTLLMWDDEFRDIPSREILNSGLNKLVEPVIWKYTKNPESSLNEQLWDNYADIWPEIWIATAFKGATEPDRYYTDISHYIDNHKKWLEIIDKYSNRIKFKGAILTGWQRYDHFSVLCELLAVSLPSLAVNLDILQSKTLGNYPSEIS